MKLKLVNKVQEAKDTKSFYFTSDTPFTWEAGQYAYLTLGNITKQFTFSSSPTENEIRITTRIRKESDFKQKLDSLEPGQEIEARAPFGVFVFDKKIKDNVYLAGGIGITPFRSFIKYNIDKKINNKILLIYSQSVIDSDFAFKDELDKCQKENSFLKIEYYDSSISGHLNRSKLSKILTNYNVEDPTFWSVGPIPYVNVIEDILEELKIPSNHVKTEKFTGY